MNIPINLQSLKLEHPLPAEGVSIIATDTGMNPQAIKLIP
jgi:hypothetical protein